MIHEVKTEKQFFQEAIDGNKPFTIRKDDRAPKYQVGDTLRKIEIANDYKGEPDSQFVDPFKVAQCWKPTGREADFVITYKLDGGQFGLASGYCVLGIKPVNDGMRKATEVLFNAICRNCNDKSGCAGCIYADRDMAYEYLVVRAAAQIRSGKIATKPSDYGIKGFEED